jgi:methyl-accepting chemotaxis protein
MSIGKKLYAGFGLVLAFLAIVFLVNGYAALRGRWSRADSRAALESVQTIQAAQMQIMSNRLNLNNFLLSGDPRDEEKVNKGTTELTDMLKRGEAQASTDLLRTALIQVESTEASWSDNFSKPLLAKRHQVDSGDATVSDLQIFYLQKDPASWLTKSSSVLDQTAAEIRKASEETFKSAERTSNWSAFSSLLLTLLAIIGGVLVAYLTAKSITRPLTHLITVAREIGDSGDLNQNIDIHRNDEIGALATTFNNLVAYLKEMAGVSMAVAEGDLTVEVVPRSKRDTLGNAFLRMSHGLQEIVRTTRDSAGQVSAGSNQVAGAADESAKVSVQASSAIEEVTSTMHEMSINVQNVVKNTQVQASSVAETSASIDQMVTSIQRVADTAKVLLDIANRSREEVVVGIQTMEKTTDGLNRTNKAIQSSAEIINVLGHRADDIGRIIEVIDRPHSEHPARSEASGREHGSQHAHRGRGPEPRQRPRHGSAQNFQRGDRSLQVLAGNRRRHQRTVGRLGADRQGHRPAHRNHPGDQLRRRRAGVRRASRRPRDGQDAGTRSAVRVELDRAFRRCRTDAEALAQPARQHGPLRPRSFRAKQSQTGLFIRPSRRGAR